MSNLRRKKRKHNDKKITKANLNNIQGVSFYNAPSQTQEGFLLVDVVIAQVGPLKYEYELPNGDVVVRNEMMSEASIFDPEFVKSCNGTPFVLDHPQDDSGQFVDVSPENFKEFTKGILIDPRVDRENGKLMGTLKIFDKEVQTLVRNGDLKEVSQGYTCNILDRSGVHAGQEFDVEQVNLTMNHLALVNNGRSGESVRILYNNSKVSIKIREFVKRRQYEMKKNEANRKRNAADAASKAEALAKKESDDATLAAADEIKKQRLNMDDSKGPSGGDDGDTPDNKDKNVLVNPSKDTAATDKKNMDEYDMDKKNMGAEVFNEVAQMLIAAAEKLQTAAGGGAEPNMNMGDMVKKEDVLNSTDVTKIAMGNILETNKTLALASTILGADEAQAASIKFNSLDAVRKFCLMKTGRKTQDEVSRMNHNQVEAHFEVLAETHKSLINAPDESKHNVFSGRESSVASGETEMTMDAFMNN